MTPTVTPLDPAVFPPEVRAFAAERGVTDYLVPLYELTQRCFPGVEVAVTQQFDYEEADLGWIVYEVGIADWGLLPYREAQDRWLDEFLRSVPPKDRGPFILGML